MQRSWSLMNWAAAGAILALAISVASLFLPPEWGGYAPWRSTHLAVPNVSAIVVRIVIFAAIGAALGIACHRTQRD